MKLSDLIPKHLVLEENIDDFSLATTKVDYSIEDLCCYVTNNIECYYWLNIESIWGPLGFVWDVINNYGHFNSNNLIFNTLPSLPDGERIKRFNNTFKNLNRDIEVYKSNWENVSQIYWDKEYRHIFIFNSSNQIPYIYLDAASPNISTPYGFLFKFNLSNTEIEIKNDLAAFIINNECNNYFPFKSLIKNDNLWLEIIENITIPIHFCIDNNIYYNILVYNDITELHLYILYNNTSNYVYSFRNEIGNNKITLYLHGNANLINTDGLFYLQINNSSYKFKDIIYEDIDNIKDKSLNNLYFYYITDRHYWYEIDKRLYDKVVDSYSYYIYFNDDEITPCPFTFNLSCYLYIYINRNCFDNNKILYYTKYNNNKRIISYLNYNLFPNYEYYKNNIIGDIHIVVQDDRNNTFDHLVLNINEKTITTNNQLFLFNNNVEKVYGITSSYYNNYRLNEFNTIDIRKKEYVVLNGDFNKITNNIDNYQCGESYLLGNIGENNELIKFDIDEVKPFDISNYNDKNIKAYHIDYLGIYTINPEYYTVTQPLIVSDVSEVFSNELYRYLEEDIFAQLNNCEIRYIYKTKLIVNKDSNLTQDKFLEIINAYIFDNSINSAKGITLEIHKTYFDLIPQDKYNQFINDGYTIVENIN